MTAFSYPLTMPTEPKPRSAKYRMVKAQTTSRSPYSFASQSYDWGGSQWQVDLEYPPMKKIEARAWVAFLLELQGKSGTFYFYPPDDPVLGTGGGTPVIDTVISNSKVSITGGPNSTTNWLLAGDWFSFANGELKRTVKAVDTNSSGHATIIFAPPSRQVPSVAGQVSTATARGIFELVSENIEFDIDLLQIHGIKLVIQEAIRV